MNPPRRAILAPLLAVLALLCAFAGTASAAFNDAARNPHYGNFLLRNSEVSGFYTAANQEGTWETDAGFYDTALGRPPWTMFDPLGLNRVVVSGGVHDDPDNDRSPGNGSVEPVTADDGDTHDSNRYNFIDSAMEQIETERGKLKEGEVVEWHVDQTSLERRALHEGKAKGYYTSAVKNRVGKQVELRFFKSARDLAENINSDSEGNARTGNSKISDIQIFGHGVPGAFWTQYGGREKITNANLDAGMIDKNAFANGATGKCWTCNAGQAPAGDGRGWIDAFKQNTGVAMPGMVGRIDYAPAAWGAKDSFRGFFTGERRSRLPVAGRQSDDSNNPNPGQPSYWRNP